MTFTHRVRFAILALLPVLAATSDTHAHDHVIYADGCCEQDLIHCTARPDHPREECQAGHAGGDLWGNCPLVGCFGLSDGCRPDIATGSVTELPNGIDDDCDYYVDDEQCDGVDNDGDGMVDDDAGSCLVRVAFVPMCWQGGDAAFVAAAEQQWQSFLVNAGLSCPDNVLRVIVKPSEANLPCPTCERDCGVFEVATAVNATLPDLRALDFDAIFSLTDQEVCGSTEGCSNGRDTIWGEKDDQNILFAHEFGHILGLHDEYCSQDAGAECGNCNRGAGPGAPANYLGADLGCDPAVGDCCRDCSTITSCSEIEVCCAGNQSSDAGGRCIMAAANAESPRYYCERCAAYMASPPDPRSDDNPTGQAPMECSFSHLGHRPVAALLLAIDESNHLEILQSEFGPGRLGPGGVPASGTHQLAILDAGGTLLHQSSLTPSFGHRDPFYLGVDYSSEHHSRSVHGIRALVPAAIDPLAPLHIVLQQGGVPVFQSTLNGSPPVADAGPDQHVECTSSGLTAVTLDGSSSFDPDGDGLTYDWSHNSGQVPIFDDATSVQPTVLLPLGTSAIDLVVRDGLDPSSADTVDVTVGDTIPPVVVLTATPAVLSPPNHSMRDIVVTASIADTCDTAPTLLLTSVTSSDPDNGQGDGNTIDDIQDAAIGTPDFALRLRSERAQGGPRTYTLTYTAIDASGNTASYTVPVIVP